MRDEQKLQAERQRVISHPSLTAITSFAHDARELGDPRHVAPRDFNVTRREFRKREKMSGASWLNLTH